MDTLQKDMGMYAPFSIDEHQGRELYAVNLALLALQHWRHLWLRDLISTQLLEEVAPFAGCPGGVNWGGGGVKSAVEGDMAPMGRAGRSTALEDKPLTEYFSAECGRWVSSQSEWHLRLDSFAIWRNCP